MEIVTTFGLKMVAISARNTKNIGTHNIFHTLQHFQPNFGIFSTTFKRFFPGVSLLAWICLDQKLNYNANCPLTSAQCRVSRFYKILPVSWLFSSQASFIRSCTDARVIMRHFYQISFSKKYLPRVVTQLKLLM